MMDIAPSNKVSLFSTTDAASYGTASYSPTANRLLIACVSNSKSGTPEAPTLSGNGLAWSQLVTFQPDTTVTQHRMTIFVAKTGTAPETGVVTAGFGGVVQVGCSIIVDECEGVDLGGTALQAIAQFKTGAVNTSGTSESVTLDNTIGFGNATYGFIQHQNAEATVPGSGYSILVSGNRGSPNCSDATEYRADGQQLVNASWTTSIQKGGIALEIKQSGGDTTPPTDPSNLSATAISPTRIDLSWQASTDNVGVTNYEVWRGGTLLTTIGNVTAYSDTSCAPSTTYSYQVKAKDAANNVSGFSNTAQATTPSGADTTPPSTPTNLSAIAVNASRIDLSWSASTDNVGVTGYDVYRDGSFLVGLGTVTTYTNQSVSPSTTYSYQVRARDAAGNVSGFSGAAQATTPALQVGDQVTWIDERGVETQLTNQAQVKHLRGQDNRYMPPVAYVEEEVPHQHGSRFRDVRYKPRDTAQPLLVEGTTKTLVREKLRSLLSALNPTRAEGRLKVVSYDGTARELHCRYAGGMEMEERKGTRGRLWQVAVPIFHAADPFWYDLGYTQQVLSQTTTTVNNTGDVDAWPEWTANGPLSSLTITNTTTGDTIALAASVGSGEVLTIDTRPGYKTAKKQDGTSLFHALSTSSFLWPLVPGSNAILVSGANVTLRYKRRWLTV